jgi:ParB-like chromosome segregation protein Spo0J
MTDSKTISRIVPDTINVAANPLRPLIDADVKRLAASMQQIGMMTPITVRYHENIPSSVDCDDSFELITGRHRLAAALSLGWDEIDAVEIECSDVDAKLWEIAENLHRAELTKLQRDEQVAMWIKLTNEKEVSAQVAPKPKGGRPQGGVRAASRDLGIDRDAANRAIKVASLSDAAKAAAVEHGLDDNRTALLEASRETKPAAQVAAIVERATRTGSPADAVKAAKTAGNSKQRAANKEGITALKAKLVEANRLRKLSGEEIRRLGKEITNEVIMRDYADRRFQKLTADACDEIPDVETPDGTSPAEQRAFNFIYRASQAIGYGKDNGFEDAEAHEITVSILNAAQDAASVWTDLVAALNKRRSKKRGGGP